MKNFPSKIHAAVSKGIKIAEKLHDINALGQACEKIKNYKPTKAYARRKWNGKLRMWEKVWKPYPPKDPFRAWM